MTKAELRKAMPKVTEFIDDIRKHFGEKSIVAIKAKENERRVDWGKPTF